MPELERLYIMDTLGRKGGDRTKTAAALGISRRNLQYRLRDYGMARSSVLNDVAALGVAAVIVIVLATILGAVERIRKILGRDDAGPAA